MFVSTGLASFTDVAPDSGPESHDKTGVPRPRSQHLSRPRAAVMLPLAPDAAKACALAPATGNRAHAFAWGFDGSAARRPGGPA
ncbi:hypothetical protein GCM10009715_04260 [Paeniglutamicibacter psychrophenolicus]